MRPQVKDGPRYDARLLERARPRPPEKISDIFFWAEPVQMKTAEPRATADAAPSIKAHATIRS
jgi:hypothetical protein